MKSKTTLGSNALLWFGAAVSLAEIMTGTYFAPLGFAKGLSAIIIGHITGGIFMYLAALIGARTNMGAMESAALSFGKTGAKIFAAANTIQLFGWTSIMLAGGAAISSVCFDFSAAYEISIVLMAGLIIACCIAGLTNISKINYIAVGLLFILSLMLSTIIFSGDGAIVSTEMISFGAAVELAAAMPVSWLPVIADYIKDAEKPVKAAGISCLTYFIVSCWMYIIGMGAAIFVGESDIAVIFVQVGLGAAALLIALLSTVTTTFLDVYSAGISAALVNSKVNSKLIMIIVCIVAALLSVFAPVNRFESFLYFIGSIFVPMIAIMITDHFVLKQKHDGDVLCIKNIVLWSMGFIIYRIFMQIDLPCGNTLPAIILISICCIIAECCIRKIKRIAFTRE